MKDKLEKNLDIVDAGPTDTGRGIRINIDNKNIDLTYAIPPLGYNCYSYAFGLNENRVYGTFKKQDAKGPFFISNREAAKLVLATCEWIPNIEDRRPGDIFMFNIPNEYVHAVKVVRVVPLPIQLGTVKP